MPREKKKRGRRGEKRKHEDPEEPLEDLAQQTSKRRKSTDEQESHDFMALAAPDETINDNNAAAGIERPFFGMLDEEEQEYFRTADDLLEANSFGSTEERDLFLANVYREAEGKELKIAQSQSCSRLMERLIRLSNPSQLKRLFQSFSGNFIHLATHRFASHCCEALFLRAAPFVPDEFTKSSEQTAASLADPNEIYVSMENLFLHTLAEFEGNLGFLVTERYASHVLRVLLLVFSGEPFDENTMKHLLQSKRKESITVQGSQDSNLGAMRKARAVPGSFTEALSKLIVDSIAGLDTDKLRALATHPHGSPALQLLLKLELTHFGKQRAKDQSSIIRQLLPDDPITADSGSAAFISGIVYDSTGSHLVEQIVEHVPAKMFKALYKQFFQERLVQFARNEIAAFVVCRVLERLGRDDLYEAHELLIPAVPGLLQKNRTLVVRKLIERCLTREVDTQVIAVQIDEAFSGSTGFEIARFLQCDRTLKSNDGDPHDSVQSTMADQTEHASSSPQNSSKVHFNVLAQAMLIAPGSLSNLVLDAMTTLDSQTLRAMAADPIVCRTLQAALTTTNASIIQRRKLIQQFYGHIGDMAADKSASHVVDCIWEGTHGLAFIRERIAEELAENEPTLRESTHGRAVWRNWKMDIYKRRRSDWVRQSKIKASNDGFQSFSEIEVNKRDAGTQPTKTPLELARERHAKAKLAKQAVHKTSSEGQGQPSGASNNAVSADGQKQNGVRKERPTRNGEAQSSKERATSSSKHDT